MKQFEQSPYLNPSHQQVTTVQEQQIQQAIELLTQGQCVGMPTETVYGLAADALNPLAVAQVFATKQRPSFDPLIVHVTPRLNLEDYVELNETAQILMQEFWPGPLTLLMKKKSIISDLVTSGHPTVAIRCPAHPFAQELINKFGGPLVAPSANLFSQLSPTSAQAVYAGLGDAIKLVIDGGPCEIGLESTIVNTTKAYPELPLLRLGGVASEALSVLGFKLSYPTPIIGQAPGTLKNHYAPRVPLYLWEPSTHSPPMLHPKPITRQLDKLDTKQAAWLGFQEHRLGFAHSLVLSKSASLTESAHRVFSSLRELGDMQADFIIAELPPERGLGRAIRDRLKRGASGFVYLDQEQWVKRDRH